MSDLSDSQKVFQLNMIAELINYYQFMFPVNRLIEIYNRNKNSFQGTIINPLTEIKEVGVQPILMIANSFNKFNSCFTAISLKRQFFFINVNKTHIFLF